jgi:hypothetical protein
MKVANSNRETAVVRPPWDELALTMGDSIGTPPNFWSDSHTTIEETMSSKFILGFDSWQRIPTSEVAEVSAKEPSNSEKGLSWSLAKAVRSIV